jgi:hypothetical protein
VPGRFLGFVHSSFEKHLVGNVWYACDGQFDFSSLATGTQVDGNKNKVKITRLILTVPLDTWITFLLVPPPITLVLMAVYSSLVVLLNYKLCMIIYISILDALRLLMRSSDMFFRARHQNKETNKI